jgi:hypothetical protein
MQTIQAYIGLDVHKETIAVAVAEAGVGRSACVTPHCLRVGHLEPVHAALLTRGLSGAMV